MATAPDVSRQSVPCGSCYQCCSGETVAYVMPWEDPTKWRTEIIQIPGHGPVHIVAKEPNGDCVYLERGKGCTIHDSSPNVCQVFDCSAGIKLFGWHGAKKQMGRSMRKQARELLKAGHVPEPPPDWLWDTIPIEHIK